MSSSVLPQPSARPPPPPNRSVLRSKPSTTTLQRSQRESDIEYEFQSSASATSSSSMRGPQPTSPKLAYFDKYPRRPDRAKPKEKPPSTELPNREHPSTSRSAHIPSASRERKPRERPPKEQQELYAWPSVSRDNVADGSSASGSTDRRGLKSPPPAVPTSRNQGSSSRPSGSHIYDHYQLAPDAHLSLASFVRSSMSSSTYTQTTMGDADPETPPRTPTPTSTPPSDGILVASGVETMDALVDQMNGGHDADSEFFPSIMKRHAKKDKTASSVSRSEAALRHHPLYHPPLPVPPEGIKLGSKEPPVVDLNDSSLVLKRPPPRSSSKPPTTFSTAQHARPSARSPSEAPVKLSRSRAMSDLTADFSPAHPSSRPSTGSRDRDREPKRDRSKHREKDRDKERERDHRSKDKQSSKDPHTPSTGQHPLRPRRSVPADLQGRSTVDAPLPPKKEPILVPSISEIIRLHAPNLARPKLLSRFNDHPPSSFTASTVLHHQLIEEDDDAMTSRSSMDSITAEVQDALKKSRSQDPSPRSLHHAKSFGDRPVSSAHSVPARDGPVPAFNPSAVRSPRSEGAYPESVYSHSTSIAHSLFPNSTIPLPSSPSLEMAQYLRSPRLTRLMTLRRHPHVGLQVSLADVGSSTGHPVMVYLGLGCVRYLIALYDEMAEALNLRLVCVDRWGLGRTGEAREGGRGLLEWASVVEEVADALKLKEYSVMAHSAGAPYALASALKMGTRVKGSIHLLAPWVSMSVDGGYKWLKFVPNGLIKTAQAAEWKMQGWMLGKPPTITHKPIGFDVTSPQPQAQQQPEQGLQTPAADTTRSSISTSDYDDLADFQGRFDSTATLPLTQVNTLDSHYYDSKSKKKPTKAFISIFGDGSRSMGANSGASIKSGKSYSKPPVIKSPKLKGLKSFGSLKNGADGAPSPNLPRRGSEPAGTPKLSLADLPPPPSIGLGLGLEDRALASEWGTYVSSPLSQSESVRPATAATLPSRGLVSQDDERPRRSLSLTTTQSAGAASCANQLPVFAVQHLFAPYPHTEPTSPSSPNTSVYSTTPTAASGNKPGITLASALLRASHAESMKGGTADLLAILERDSKPWGFSYADVRHPVKVWYGDRDEKIAISSVHWMERVMKECNVNIVKGGGHGLMTNTDVVVEVLESIAKEWGRDMSRTTTRI